MRWHLVEQRRARQERRQKGVTGGDVLVSARQFRRKRRGSAELRPASWNLGGSVSGLRHPYGFAAELFQSLSSSFKLVS